MKLQSSLVVTSCCVDIIEDRPVASETAAIADNQAYEPDDDVLDRLEELEYK